MVEVGLAGKDLRWEVEGCSNPGDRLFPLLLCSCCLRPVERDIANLFAVLRWPEDGDRDNAGGVRLIPDGSDHGLDEVLVDRVLCSVDCVIRCSGWLLANRHQLVRDEEDPCPSKTATCCCLVGASQEEKLLAFIEDGADGSVSESAELGVLLPYPNDERLSFTSVPERLRLLNGVATAEWDRLTGAHLKLVD